MPGVELRASACDDHVVVALRGELDVTGVAEAEAGITARYLVIDMSSIKSSRRFPSCLRDSPIVPGG